MYQKWGDHYDRHKHNHYTGIIWKADSGAHKKNTYFSGRAFWFSIKRGVVTMNMKEHIRHLLWKYEHRENEKPYYGSTGRQLYLDDFDKAIT